VSRLLNILNNDYVVSTEKVERILGLKFTRVEPVMLEYLYQAIELGRIPDVRKTKKRAKL
jgi:hypothetical protein